MTGDAARLPRPLELIGDLGAAACDGDACTIPSDPSEDEATGSSEALGPVQRERVDRRKR